MKTQVNIKLLPNYYEKLKRLAKARGWPMGQIVERMLDKEKEK